MYGRKGFQLILELDSCTDISQFNVSNVYWIKNNYEIF